MNPTQENKYQDDESRDDEEHRVRIMDTVEAVEVDDVRCDCTPIDKCATPIDQKSTKRRVTFVEEDVIIQIYNEANSLADDDDDDDDSMKTLVDDRNIFDRIFCVSCS